MEMTVLAELSVFPVGEGTSVSADVAAAVALIRDSGVPYRLTPMGTIIETETVGESLAVVGRCCDLLVGRGCGRVYCTTKLDIRAGTGRRMDAKIDSVTARIGTVAT
jgi:uncharacterized protein (TIGR00106 family)